MKIKIIDKEKNICNLLAGSTKVFSGTYNECLEVMFRKNYGLK